MAKNEVFLNDIGMIEIVIHGDQTAASVQAMADKTVALGRKLRAAGKRVLILDVLLDMGSVPPEGRKIVVETGKTGDYDRLAMVGSGSLLRLGANLMFQATGKANKLKYFEDYNKAVAWLEAFRP